ncbi:rust resistance kinase Lr10-like [Impatiens glandulifera]|uniref:rust resistance kinase Lr10-like n=1 Tax=Impatiens glandulifera TaxID=253017 RepID=UPI001FB187FB|nr:rust resistance kinase Lr10-like [Impatiens glandulifera]
MWCSAYFGRKKQAKVEVKRKAKEFIKTYQSSVLRSYTYNDLNKMTDGFKEKLGKGGFGSVFKGTLRDGTPIAVKMLKNYVGDHDRSDFLNEITTISMIRHFNIIRLLGFSWDGSNQALVYEFMPNGSIGDLLGGSIGPIRQRKLLEIATGVAHGIEYLHIGCDVRILHLDIKPQNILLDHNFSPKISDFGLAMTYSRNRSAITMPGGAKGTIGYIAPEVFMRNFGKPSDKSDVYSFGMLLLEMAGAKDRPLDLQQQEGSSSNDYFPNWVYEKLLIMENHKENFVELDEEEDMMIRKKIAMVGLWCIQINPRHRPSMTRVVEMLLADMEAIEMPPKPISFFSSGQQPLEYEITSFQSEDSSLPLTGIENN